MRLLRLTKPLAESAAQLLGLLEPLHERLCAAQAAGCRVLLPREGVALLPHLCNSLSQVAQVGAQMRGLLLALMVDKAELGCERLEKGALMLWSEILGAAGGSQDERAASPCVGDGGWPRIQPLLLAECKPFIEAAQPAQNSLERRLRHAHTIDHAP